MLKTILKFENHGSSGLHYIISRNSELRVPGHAIGNAGVLATVDAGQAAAITAAVKARRPAMAVTVVQTYDDGVSPQHMPYQKNNYTATANPAVTDDETKKYSEGSVWINTTSTPREVFRCVSAATGAAVWVNTSLEQSELGSMALQEAGDVTITGGAIEAALTPTNDMDIPETKVYKVNGVQVVGAPGATVGAASAVTGTATENGFGFATANEMNNFVSGVNGIKDTVNAAIARLQGHGLIT